MTRRPPSPLLGLAVVVPAHDEQEVVTECLDAVAVALARVAAAAPHVATVAVVALDSCRDATADLVAARGHVETVVVERRAVGAARRSGTAHALARLGLPAHRVWTAHTDADSRVPADWLVRMTVAADLGVDALFGTVVPDAMLAGPDRARWTALHPPHEGHPFVHGANLGVRASTLAAVGGWRPLRTGEDVDLERRLRRGGRCTLRSTARIPVVTSARRVARAPAGFSGYLRELTLAAPGSTGVGPVAAVPSTATPTALGPAGEAA